MIGWILGYYAKLDGMGLLKRFKKMGGRKFGVFNDV